MNRRRAARAARGAHRLTAERSSQLAALALACAQPDRRLAMVGEVLEVHLPATAGWHLRREIRQDARHAHECTYAVLSGLLRPFVEARLLSGQDAEQAAQEALMAAADLAADRARGAAWRA